MIQARVPAALLACAAGFVLGPPKDNAFHPWASARSVVSQRHRIIACASTSSLARDPAPPESIGSTAKSPRAQARITGSIVSALSFGGEDRTPFFMGRSCRSSASHEVCFPSAHPAANALSRAARLWTIPLRPWLTSRPRASRTMVEESAGPCGLSLRGSNAVLLDVGTTREVCVHENAPRKRGG